jgi:hypothetical protein
MRIPVLSLALLFCTPMVAYANSTTGASDYRSCLDQATSALKQRIISKCKAAMNLVDADTGDGAASADNQDIYLFKKISNKFEEKCKLGILWECKP